MKHVRIGRVVRMILLPVFFCGIFALSGCEEASEYFFEEGPAANTLSEVANSETVGSELTEGISAEEVTEVHEEDLRIYVHVCGAVQCPGVYELTEGDRIDAAVNAAGGFTEDARQQAVNLAAILTDGTQVYVPSVDEAAGSAGTGEGSLSAGSASGGNQKININTASAGDLKTLNGIGESKANSIIRYREEQGLFTSIEDIKNVDGIGDGIFEKIKDDIVV